MPGVADAWGPDGSGSWWGRRARGRELVLGWLAGLLRAGGPSRPSLLWVCFPSLSFPVLFSSPLFEFKFGLKFEFQIGVPFRYDAHIIFIYI